MKKILFIILIFFMSVTASFASFYVDLLGAYVDAGDMKTQSGWGLGLGWGITDNVNLLVRAIDTDETKDKNTDYESTYEHFTTLAGFEYTPELPVLEQFQTTWSFSILGGMAKSNYEYHNPITDKDEDESDMGIGIAFWTGPHFYLAQNISFFVEVGYHDAIYSNDFKNASINGFQAVVGIRWYFCGARDYTSGF